MFNWRSLHASYINLSHRTDRLERMEAELLRVGLSAERFEAVKTTDDSWNREPYKVMYKRSKGAIGCMLSQMSVMAEAYSKGVGAMVLEDDLVFCSDVVERLDYIENFVTTKEPEFDIIFLGGTVHINPSWWHKKGHDSMLQMCKCKLGRDADRIDDERMIRVYGMFSTHAYIVRYESVPKILNLLHEVMSFTIGIDYSLILKQPELRCFAFMPGCVKQYNNQSDIGDGVTYFENFSVLGPHWWQDRMEYFNPSAYNWNEADKMNRIEDTLNGGYDGLFGEVVTEDTYKIKELKFVPDIAFDFGSNISVFTRYIRSLFPNCFIVAVEPDKDNYEIAKKFTPQDDKILLINKAIGIGQVYHGLTAANGSGETYLSCSTGYPKDKLEEAANNNSGIERSNVETLMPGELINRFVKEGDKVLVKIDCEGAENLVFSHPESMEALCKVDYLCMEVHRYALFGGEIWQEVQDKTREALDSFKHTHDVEEDGVHFFATLKK